MKQEEKDLLLKDLCARLPYGVICEDGYGNVLELTGIDKPNTATFKCSDNTFWTTDLDKCKPYLFPLSSMTKEQMKELEDLCDMYTPDDDDSNYAYQGIQVLYKHVLDDGYEPNIRTDVIDWFNKNRLDWRGLIPMGLAKDATGLNIY